MKIDRAKKFIELSGTPLEIARLNYLIHHTPASYSIYSAFIERQKEDGGWLPFWSPTQSSIDATCYRLAQLEQLGINRHKMIDKAINFILSRKKKDGSFEEEGSLETIAPPWAKPGDLSATLYLTANCAFWIEYFCPGSEHVREACEYLSNHFATGKLLSFFHTNWIAGALFRKIMYIPEADTLTRYLVGKVDEMSASNLAWLINAFYSMNVFENIELVQKSVSRLTRLQQPDGRWISDDGSDYDVHTTLEALRSILAYEKKSIET